MKPFTQNRFLVSLVGILLLANLAFFIYWFAFKKSEHPHPPPRRPVSEFIKNELGFDTVQAEKFQQLRDKHKEAIKPLMEEMQKLKDSLYASLEKSGTTDSTVNLIADKIGAKQKEIEIMLYHHFEDVRAICTPNQLPRFDSLVHKMINRGLWMRKGKPGEKKPE